MDKEWIASQIFRAVFRFFHGGEQGFVAFCLVRSIPVPTSSSTLPGEFQKTGLGRRSGCTSWFHRGERIDLRKIHARKKNRVFPRERLCRGVSDFHLIVGMNGRKASPARAAGFGVRSNPKIRKCSVDQNKTFSCRATFPGPSFRCWLSNVGPRPDTPPLRRSASQDLLMFFPAGRRNGGRFSEGEFSAKLQRTVHMYFMNWAGFAESIEDN